MKLVILSSMRQAIMAIRNWGNQYGYPYKVISDTGPAFREDFIRQLLTFILTSNTNPAVPTILRETASPRGGTVRQEWLKEIISQAHQATLG